jgi:hypothetical protein
LVYALSYGRCQDLFTYMLHSASFHRPLVGVLSGASQDTARIARADFFNVGCFSGI